MIQYLYLGRVAYEEALRLQAELVEARYQGRIENLLLLLEHPPVLTLGRNANRSNVLASDALLASQGVTLHEINRGGDVTYHGPGQLVGYPIFDLRGMRGSNAGRMGPVDFVRGMEEALIRVCSVYGVTAGRIAGLTGVWCGLAQAQNPSKELPSEGERKILERKIGAIGIHVSRGITSHGFAFNVTTNLEDFRLINPCGLTDRPVTSLKRELEREMAGRNNLPTLESVALEAAKQFGSVFGEPIVAMARLEDLPIDLPIRGGAPEPAPPQPMPEDTPLQVPREVERLAGKPDRPVNA
jgi:lipoyl(octanoyl) transferase